MAKDNYSFPRFRQSTRKNHYPSFPIAMKDLTSFIEERYLDYAIDPGIDSNTIIIDRNADFQLICKYHGNTKFSTKWRYMVSRANGSSGICHVCHAEIKRKNNSLHKVHIAKFVDEDMRTHQRHPTKLIDKRYSPYDRINHREKILIECLECGWNKDEVSIANFFVSEPHVDKCYRCKGCVQIGKYGYPKGPSDEELKKDFLMLEYDLTTEIVTGENPEKYYILKCKNCTDTKKYTRKQILNKAQYKNKIYCEECKRIANYYKKKEEIRKKGFLLETPLNNYVGVIQNGKHVLYDFKCVKDKHTIKRTMNGFAKTNGCIECKIEVQNKKSFLEFKKEVERRGGIVKKNEKLINRSKTLKCRCGNNHKFNISYEKLFDRGQWCKTCSVGVGERIARIYIEHFLGYPGGFPNLRPDIMNNPDTGYNLELDGYNESKNVAFEYGVEGDMYHRTKTQLKYDSLKAELCKKNGVLLIKIPEFKNYAKKEENARNVIAIIRKMGLEIKNDTIDIDISEAYSGTESLKRLNSIIEEKEGKLITGYNGLDGEVEIQCKSLEHQPIKRTARDIIHAGAWCAICKEEDRENEKFKKYKLEFTELVAWLNENKKLFLDEPIENFKNEIEALQFTCKNNHKNPNSLLNIRRKKKDNITFCLKCANLEKLHNYLIENLKQAKNFATFSTDKITLKNGFTITWKESERKTLSWTVICNGKTPHTLPTKKFKLNHHVKNNFWECPHCKFEEYNLLIKNILGKQARYIETKEGKHYWNCGVDGHKDFEQSLKELKERKEAGCCEVCFPRKNTQKTKEQILNKAIQLHKEISGCDLVPLVLDQHVEFKSRERIPYKCHHKDHLPFFVSYDNMNRKNHWCPECQGRNRNNLKEDMEKILQLESLPNTIRNLIEQRIWKD